MEQLSRRLHQMWVIPGEIRGIPRGAGIKCAMIRYRTTRRLPAHVASYVAGLIDGEGTVTLCRRHSNENRQLVVSVANTELPILQFLIDHIGTGKITRKRAVSAQHTPSFCYSISNRQALDLLGQVAPYLRSYKRLRTKLILARYKSVTPRNGKYSSAARINRALFEREVLALSVRSTTSSRYQAEPAN
jgi:hypothetical protein